MQVHAEPDHARGIPTDMTLSMQNALSGNVAELGRFNRIRGILAGSSEP